MLRWSSFWAPLPEAERKDALSYYEDYLDAAGPENEARAIASWAPRGGRPQNSGRTGPGRQLCRPGIPCPAFPLAHGAGRRAGSAGAGLLFLPALQGYPGAAGGAAASSAVDSSSVPEESNGTHLAVPADTVPLTIPADDLGESTLQIPLEKLDQELKLSLNYGSVTFVTDPSLTSDKYATFQFDNFPHSPVLRTTGGDGRTTLTLKCRKTGR